MLDEDEKLFICRGVLEILQRRRKLVVALQVCGDLLAGLEHGRVLRVEEVLAVLVEALAHVLRYFLVFLHVPRRLVNMAAEALDILGHVLGELGAGKGPHDGADPVQQGINEPHRGEDNCVCIKHRRSPLGALRPKSITLSSFQNPSRRWRVSLP